MAYNSGIILAKIVIYYFKNYAGILGTSLLLFHSLLFAAFLFLVMPPLVYVKLNLYQTPSGLKVGHTY